MKLQLLFYISLCLVQLSAQAQTKAIVQYREETELISVVAHLAKVPGFVWDAEDDGMPQYTKEVDSIFAPYLQHPAVQFVASKLINKGFAWNTPNAVALQFKLINGKITRIKNLKPDTDYYEKISIKNETQLLQLLQKFYNETHFHQFFEQHKVLYAECEQAMKEVVNQIDFEWYNTFFGTKSNVLININMGLLNGPGNFATLQFGKDSLNVVNALMGCCTRNKEGHIYYGIPYTLPIIIHECNHSFCNSLNEEVWEQIKDNATKLYNTNPKHYRSIAYGNPLYVMNETFVEACVMRYLMSHNVDLNGYTVEDLIKADEDKKFNMIRDVIQVLGEREAHPEQYKTMRHFMPRYVEAINNYKVK